ncbi:calcium-binding protein [Pseudomonas panipatensis]|uniref:Hemolysin-type calcium-binding repeat-containing protein n=1 Tax=Pseudomonas panipatensis TaxID=428992 RepID=A0A1G8C3F4_9PSED|nr:calcium-binding protein [Pseudomonas panipatensis]SDH39923.1 Hemolysin-type calcium-binding repeat-containing protein [Pseudomonas panipatensis]SMP66350.1 Hemolysin-type calcium-binding repeat-containing protein [Pseudomonas panipatensis]
MAIFDYKNQDARTLIADAWTLASYSSGTAVAGGLFKLTGLLFSRPSTNYALTNGWRELAPGELGLSHDRLDLSGQFKGEGVPDSQARVFGQYDNQGALRKVAFSIAGTNSLVDVPFYLKMIDNSYIRAFDYLLDAIKGFAGGHGLSGKDVLVTGYSLGGGAVNNMYLQRESLADGFFKDADYVGLAAPKINDGDGIINVGFENDVVFRAIGQTSDPLEAINNALHGHDNRYDSTLDNIVLFDSTYLQPTWPNIAFSILNITNWSAHIGGVFSNPIALIGQSSFYDFIERDSTIVISNLAPASRSLFWVSDKPTSTSDHYGTPAFLLGSDGGDKLQDGRSDDFLDGFAGNDKFRLSTGTDVVAGGSGNDTVYLPGQASDYEAMRLSDGSLLLNDINGRYGLKELHDVEQIAFMTQQVDNPLLDPLLALVPTYTVKPDRLDYNGWFGRDKGYSAAQEGSRGNDLLHGSQGNDRIVGLSGDDILHGNGGNDLLHGGAGNDRLLGGTGNDQLYGGAGDDWLQGGVGNDLLSGGVGSDRFVFDQLDFGQDRISDFNLHQNGVDTLVFSRNLFASKEAVVAAASQQGNDTLIRVGDSSLILAGLEATQLQMNMISVI